MGKQNNRRIVYHLAERGGEIVDPNPLDGAIPPRRSVSQLIAETGEPERTASLVQALDIILIDRNAGRFERAAGSCGPPALALHRSVIPIIMIAEDGVHTEWRLETGEHGRPFIGRNESCDIPVTGDVIAKQDGDVSAERVGMFDNRLDMLQRHPG